jgi:hypothetical protein
MPLTPAIRHRLRVNPLIGYVVVTMNGVQFVEAWYHAERIPAKLVCLYQFLLRLVWMHGRAPVNVVGYNTLLKIAQLKGYVKIKRQPERLPNGVHERIMRLRGDAPREIYA